MPENIPSQSTTAPTTQEPAAPQATPIPFSIGEEFGTARKNLPPTRIVLIGVGLILVIGAVVAFVQRPRQTAAGTIDNIVVAPVPNQKQVMVAIGLTLQNRGKTLYVVNDIKADIEVGNDSYSDSAASAVDFERYFQAFPALMAHARDPLKLGATIEPGGEIQSTIIVSFPVMRDAFTNRKSLTVTVTPKDQQIPLVLTK
jgi:hypothetical protein